MKVHSWIIDNSKNTPYPSGAGLGWAKNTNQGKVIGAILKSKTGSWGKRVYFYHKYYNVAEEMPSVITDKMINPHPCEGWNSDIVQV